MPRPQSIRLRLARVLNTALARMEDALNRDPAKVPTEAEARTLVNLAKADQLVQGRKPEAGEDDEPVGTADPKAAAELVNRIREGMTMDPTARRVDGDDDADP